MRLLVLISMFITLPLQASLLPKDIHVPKQQMHQINNKANKSMVKRTIKRFKKTFKKSTPFGSKLSINDVWWSTTFNAYAMKYGPVWRITVHGGLLKHKSLSADLLSLVLCHELGHFLGGAPKYKVVGKKWSSFEGQADYWTGQRCLKKLWKKDNNKLIVKKLAIPNLAKAECDANYKSNEARALCYRVSYTGLKMGKLIAEILVKPSPALTTPDTTIVDTTYPNHPNFQCRVDTYFQAALCEASGDISDKDETKGSCYHQAIGSRPACWYAK